MANQHDVARETGLSQTTISRVLRGDSAVTEETRSKVVEACWKLGYRPSIGARMLVRGRSAVIGLSLSARELPTDRYVATLHQTLALELHSSGWGTRLVTPGQLPSQLEEVGALILIGVSPNDPRITICRKAGRPVVVIGYPSDTSVPSVVPDDAGGARQAIAHLVKQGRKRLVMLSSFTASGGDHALHVRKEAALNAAVALGVSIQTIHVEKNVSPTLTGYRAVMHSRQQLSGADGMFCDTDEHALGAIAALRDLGKRVPEEVSVVGFDDIPGLSASLTTVRQDFHSIARSAISLCQEAEHEQSDSPIAPHILPVELVIRET